MESAAQKGIESLFGISPVVTILVLVIMGLCWFIKGLLRDARDDRKSMTDALINSTAVMTTHNELLRDIKATVSK